MCLAGKAILVVEDEFLIRLDLQLLLEMEGADVVTASSVQEGLRIVDDTPDLSAALLDVRLPDGDIYPVARKLDDDDVPIIFHSAHAKAHDLHKRFPGSASLSKPASEARLVNMLARKVA